MKYKLIKKINAEQLTNELKTAGIKVKSITIDKDNSIIIDSNKDPQTIVKDHTPQAIISPKERLELLRLEINKLDIKDDLKGILIRITK